MRPCHPRPVIMCPGSSSRVECVANANAHTRRLPGLCNGCGGEPGLLGADHGRRMMVGVEEPLAAKVPP
jgi:hypothetical protein